MNLFRKPDLVIGDDYLCRWYVIPRNPWFNIYLHKFTGSDIDTALHDHPWWSCSFLLKGEAIEHTRDSSHMLPRFIPVFRSARFAHRIELVKGPVWTLFVTGPRIREWGFYCPKGWKHWTKFTNQTGDKVGAGCGED